MSYSSNRPYLISAMLDWIVDNHLTPHILVDADYPALAIPREYIIDGRIVLNIAPSAVRDFMLSAKVMTFHARFSGERQDIYIPLGAIEAIYPYETGEGIHFHELDKNPPPLPDQGEQQMPFKASGSVQKTSPNKKPHLSIVRTDAGSDKKDPTNDH